MTRFPTANGNVQHVFFLGGSNGMFNSPLGFFCLHGRGSANKTQLRLLCYKKYKFTQFNL